MAARITPEEIVRINQLYNKYGTYAEVARKVGRSASAVAKHVKMKDTPQIVRHTFKEVIRGQEG